MQIDRLIDQVIGKRNPCIVGIDPEWGRIPECYRSGATMEADCILQWGRDVIDAVSDIVPAVKPQMAFFEAFGADGIRVHQEIVRYARTHGLIVIDDSKRNDIGNTARAYAFAHLSRKGPINADFMTISPFLGSDSMRPFLDEAIQEGKGLFILVKTSNPSSWEISGAVNARGVKISDWLADFVRTEGEGCIGRRGYSSIGAVVGATFPEEAGGLRQRMKNNFFLVPGFGAQGGSAVSITACFNEDGLGAVVSSSRGILYRHLDIEEYDHSREMYMEIVRRQAIDMRNEVYRSLKNRFQNMAY